MYIRKYFEGIELSDEKQKKLIQIIEEIEDSQRQCLINISNHPSNKWETGQSLDYGKVIDIPFPAINYDSNFQRIADSIYDTIRNRYHRTPRDCTVMVQGQHVATFAIVATLMSCGFRCVSAFTDRIVSENPDGTKLSRFVFGGYQEYSSIHINNHFIEELIKQILKE